MVWGLAIEQVVENMEVAFYLMAVHCLSLPMLIM